MFFVTVKHFKRLLPDIKPKKQVFRGGQIFKSHKNQTKKSARKKFQSDLVFKLLLLFVIKQIF